MSISLDVRAIAFAALTEMRQKGESYEMCARWISERVPHAVKDCEWTEDGEGYWRTGCNKHFEFSDGGLADNGFEFCPFCGDAVHLQNEADS